MPDFWIPVADRLPPPQDNMFSEEVLVCVGKRNKRISVGRQYYSFKEGIWFLVNGYQFTSRVYWWMHLPTMPVNRRKRK